MENFLPGSVISNYLLSSIQVYKSLGLTPQCRLISGSKNDHFIRKEPFCSLVYFSFCLKGNLLKAGMISRGAAKTGTNRNFN